MLSLINSAYLFITQQIRQDDGSRKISRLGQILILVDANVKNVRDRT